MRDKADTDVCSLKKVNLKIIYLNELKDILVNFQWVSGRITFIHHVKSRS